MLRYLVVDAGPVCVDPSIAPPGPDSIVVAGGVLSPSSLAAGIGHGAPRTLTSDGRLP